MNTENTVSILEMETNSNENQLEARKKLQYLFQNHALPIDELMSNFGLFTRGSVLVKTLVLNEIYQKILSVPGWIVEFGSWWGQNLIMFENLRAIHEPFNKTRKIIGFDTFEGYQGQGEFDSDGLVIKTGNYAVANDYKKFLEILLRTHEQCNVLGHNSSGHQIVTGDVRETAPSFFEENKHSFVALAYFDMGLYEPTKVALESIKTHLLPGSVLVFDELTWEEAKGEALAFKEVFVDVDYKIESSLYTPMRAYVTIVSM